MAPIKVGIIGLSAKDAWTWGAVAHLPYLKASPNYKIVALLNSTKEAAEAAIKAYDLGSDTKAYENPEDLAADSNVELVVCSVTVNLHYDLIKPSILAGKDQYVEWPLGANLEQAEELTKLAKEKGIKTAVGLQARLDPVVHKIKSLVESGRIGKLLSTTIVAQAYNLGGAEPLRLKYMLDINNGGNVRTIQAEHLLDAVNTALGQFSSYNALLANQRKTSNLVDKDGKVVERDLPKTSHDQILIQGTLENGAVLSFHMRGGKPSDGTALRWWIYGTEGEILLTSPAAGIQISPATTVTLFNMETGPKGEEVKVDVQEGLIGDLKGLSPAANVSRIYEAFRKGETGKFASFEDAVKRHKFIDDNYKAQRAN